MTEEKPISETHPSLEIYTILSGKPFVWVVDVQKHTTDNQRIREALKKVLTSEYEGQVAVMPEYYELLKTLGLEE